MKVQRLSIAEIQIYFDASGVALFSAGQKPRAAVELDLNEYREFIERWLEASEEPRPRVLTQDEHQLRSALKKTAKGFKHHFDEKEVIELILREAAQRRPESTSLTAAQLEEAVAYAISAL